MLNFSVHRQSGTPRLYHTVRFCDHSPRRRVVQEFGADRLCAPPSRSTIVRRRAISRAVFPAALRLCIRSKARICKPYRSLMSRGSRCADRNRSTLTSPFAFRAIVWTTECCVIRRAFLPRTSFSYPRGPDKIPGGGRVSRPGESACVGAASRPAPIRHSLRMAPEGWSFSPPFLGGRTQYSLRPWKQYEFAHAIRWARHDSAHRNRSAASLLSFRGLILRLGRER